MDDPATAAEQAPGAPAKAFTLTDLRFCLGASDEFLEVHRGNIMARYKLLWLQKHEGEEQKVDDFIAGNYGKGLEGGFQLRSLIQQMLGEMAPQGQGQMMGMGMQNPMMGMGPMGQQCPMM